jgi:hypothetical protein
MPHAELVTDDAPRQATHDAVLADPPVAPSLPARRSGGRRTLLAIGVLAGLGASALAFTEHRPEHVVARSLPVERVERVEREAAAPSHEPAAAALVSAPDTEPPGFMGRPEREIRERLAREAVVAAKKGSGGRTLAFKITLESGIQGYFKPEQSVSSAHWYAELAAYHLDRALGLGRVPPVVGRTVPWRALQAAAGDDARIAELSIAPDGKVRGALIHWLDERLTPALTPPGWENWIRCEPFSRYGISPYQRASSYGRALTRAHDRLIAKLPVEAHYQSVPEPERAALPSELSDMIVFDFLTLNYDRFGGENINILTLGAGGPLIFLDNGDGFSDGPPRRSVLDERLAQLSRFRKSTIDALRALDVPAFKQRLERETLAPILSDTALGGLAVRREAVLEHVAAQRARFGDAVFAW